MWHPIFSSCSIFILVFSQCLCNDSFKQSHSHFQNVSQNLMMCYSKSPINLSDDICGDLCEKGAVCSKESGACICDKEPTPTSLGGHFTHCTNWNYVEQSRCKSMCQEERKNDSRVCWTFTVGNYCTCF